MSDESTRKRRMWATPKNYSFKDSHTPGLTTLDIQVRGLYPDQERYHGVKPAVSAQLTLFAEAFPVSLIVSPADAAPPPTTATSGRSSPDLFASCDPDGSWLKTSQGYSQANLDGSLERFSETWPRSGMTRSGIAYLRQPSAPLTGGIESGLWPTPCAQEDNKSPAAHMAMKARMKGGPRYTVTSLQVAAKVWPTPSAEMDSGGHRGSLDTLHSAIKAEHPNNGGLNPTWVEWLMGYPIGWTVCEAWETRSSRKSRSGSVGAFSKRRT